MTADDPEMPRKMPAMVREQADDRRIGPGQTGMAGEHFVTGELLRRGWLAAMANGNSPVSDILASKGARIIQIQVNRGGGEERRAADPDGLVGAQVAKGSRADPARRDRPTSERDWGRTVDLMFFDPGLGRSVAVRMSRTIHVEAGHNQGVWFHFTHRMCSHRSVEPYPGKTAL